MGISRNENDAVAFKRLLQAIQGRHLHASFPTLKSMDGRLRDLGSRRKLANADGKARPGHADLCRGNHS